MPSSSETLALTPAQRRAFIQEHTVVATPPIVPEICLHLATEVTPLWEATEVTLARVGLPPPFWAFCWPGGQALARYVIDHPEIVKGRRVLDFAAGCGVASIASLKSGAASVVASEIDPFAIEAMRLNAAINGTAFEATDTDLVDQDGGWDVVFAGDVCYERPAAERITRWLGALARRGAVVLMGDPGRTYMPHDGVEALAEYVVPTSRDLEDKETRTTRIWRFVGGPQIR